MASQTKAISIIIGGTWTINLQTNTIQRIISIYAFLTLPISKNLTILGGVIRNTSIVNELVVLGAGETCTIFLVKFLTKLINAPTQPIPEEIIIETSMTASPWIKEQTTSVDGDDGGDEGGNWLFGCGCGGSGFISHILHSDDGGGSYDTTFPILYGMTLNTLSTSTILILFTVRIKANLIEILHETRFTFFTIVIATPLAVSVDAVAIVFKEESFNAFFTFFILSKVSTFFHLH